MTCRNITDDMRGRIKKAAKAGAFNNKSSKGGNTLTTARSTATKYKRKGAVNVVVEEEDNDEKTEVKENGMPS